MERGPELLKLTVHGQPAGAGSKTAEVATRGRGGPPIKDANGRYVLRYRHASKFTAPWMKLVEKEARLAWLGREALSGALWLDVFFYEARVQAHYFQRKSGRVLRPDAPAYPAITETHDVDKMRRAISDALTNAAVLADDKRVIGGEAWKDYAENVGRPGPCAVITVGRMVAQTVAEAGLISPDPVDQAALPVG